MGVICKNCGGSHPKWDCTRPQKESTAARKDVLSGEQGRMGVMSSTPSVRTAILEAGTQALPVDTHSKANFDRNKYQREYMRDRATIKRLGLEMTVAEWRKTNAKPQG